MQLVYSFAYSTSNMTTHRFQKRCHEFLSFGVVEKLRENIVVLQSVMICEIFMPTAQGNSRDDSKFVQLLKWL